MSHWIWALCGKGNNLDESVSFGRRRKISREGIGCEPSEANTWGSWGSDSLVLKGDVGDNLHHLLCLLHVAFGSSCLSLSHLGAASPGFLSRSPFLRKPPRGRLVGTTAPAGASSLKATTVLMLTVFLLSSLFYYHSRILSSSASLYWYMWLTLWAGTDRYWGVWTSPHHSLFKSWLLYLSIYYQK